jgi:hypothetical protein
LSIVWLSVDGELWEGDGREISPTGHGTLALEHGARLHTSDHKVEVKIEGIAVVSVGRRNEGWKAIEMAEILIGFVRGQVIPALEPFVRT